MISVIVPIYNVEEYLRRCVDSLLQQTYADLEVILVDDGSPDGCGAICDAYASQEPRVRAVHKPNGGLSDARNAGLLVAAGDEIAFVDSDDWVAPDFLAAMHDALTRTGADIVECSVVKTAGDAAGGAAFGGTAIAPEVPSGPEDTARAIAGAREAGAPPAPAVYSAEPALRELIHDGVFHQTVWNKLYRRSVLEGILFPVGRTNEDEFWTYQAFARAARIARIELPLYYYFQRPGSIMGASFSLRRLDALDAKTERQAYIEAHFPALARDARMNLFGTCTYLAQMSLRHLKGEELAAARRKLKETYTICRPEKEDLAPLSARERFWPSLARLSLFGTARLKNLLRRGL